MLISAEQLTKHQNVKCIVKNVSFAIEDHDKIALIGINGAGKTTLLRMIAGEEVYEAGRLIKKNGLRLSYLPQEPQFDEEDTILHQILTMDKEIQEFEAKSILGKLGIFDVQQKVSILSGGQRKRVALAKALLKPCDLLILDEPTNHLDNTMIEWLEKYLIKFPRAILMVTHDRYFLERVCHRMFEIDKGNVHSYDANYSQFLELKAQREGIEQANERKRQNILRKELAWIRAGVQARGTKSKERIDRFHQLNDMEKPQGNAQVLMDTITSRLGKKTIEFKDLAKSYGDKHLFQNFSYHMGRNDRIGILGPNGCGKSTLLHILAKDILPDSGEVVHGETVKIAYFKQGYEDMDDTMRVIDYIKNISNEIKTTDGSYSASQMLERFLFDSQLQYSLIGRLSGGERRRLYLLNILMQAPNILFLDEPTNDLDIQTLQILEDYLDQFNGALICVSHDRYFLDRICDKLFVFQANATIEQFIGGYSQYVELETSMQMKKEKTIIQKDVPKQSIAPRFTSKERKELETIDEQMEELEQDIKQHAIDMEAYMDDFVKVQQLSDESQALEQRLEEMSERWLYLNEKKQEIDDFNKKK